MSDESTPAPAPESKPTAPAARPTAPPSILTRPTDAAARPGFRSAANTKSKAQKKKK